MNYGFRFCPNTKKYEFEYFDAHETNYFLKC